MSSQTVWGGLDATVKLAYPETPYPSAIRLQVKSGTHESFVFKKSPVPAKAGMTVTSAVLRIRNAAVLVGSTTLTVKRVAVSPKWARMVWNNRPGVTGAAASQTVTSPGAMWWEIDVTAIYQAFADGAPNYGLKLTTNATDLLRLYAHEADLYQPTLVIEWTDKPDKPDIVHPVNGKAVDVDKPVVRMSYSDPGGDDALDAVQVQIDAGNVFTSGIDFDSGWVTTTEPVLDLALTAYAGLADGATTYLRGRVRDEAGGISDWSDVVSFSRDDKGTLTLTNPAVSPNNFVDEFTPPIAWTFTGETQKSYRVMLAKAARPHTWIYDSGRITSAANEHGIPFRGTNGRRILIDDQDYRVVLRVWDTEDRCGIAYVQASREFTVQYDNTLAPVTAFTATQAGLGPWVTLQWDRATLPDQWVIVRDGEVIAKEDIASDLLVSGTTYRFVDYTARPGVEHTYRIRAVDIVTSVRKMAATSPTATITPEASGFWLINYDGTLEIRVGGVDSENMAYGEDSSLYTPVGAQSVVKITHGLRGLEGSITGPIRDTEDGRSWDDHQQGFLAMKARPTQLVRLAFGDRNIPVLLRDMSSVPASSAFYEQMTIKASFAFAQHGELPFDAEI